MRRRPAGEVGVGACVGRAAVGPLAVLLHNTRGRVRVVGAMAPPVSKRGVAQRTRIAELAVGLCRLGEAGALVDTLAANIEFHHLIL